MFGVISFFSFLPAFRGEGRVGVFVVPVYAIHRCTPIPLSLYLSPKMGENDWMFIIISEA